MMNTFRTTVLLMALLLCSMTAMSQYNHCDKLEQQYGDPRIKDSVLIEETFLSLCDCYLDEVRAALDNHNCKVAETYYAKYKALSKKSNTELERRIEDCKNPTGVLEIEGNKTILKDAEVSIDGDKVLDPTVPQILKPGEYRLSVVHKDYDRYEKNLTIVEYQTTKVKVPFTCHGILRIEGDYALLSRASISLDGDMMTNPPINSDKSEPCGTYTLRAKLNGHKTFEQVVTVEKGKTTKVSVDLPVVVVEKYGYLKLEEKAGILSSCSVYIDSEKWTNPQATKKLKIGTYTISVEHEGYETFTDQVKIHEDETTSLQVAMVPLKCEGSFKIVAGNDKDKEKLEQATLYFDDKNFSNFVAGNRFKSSCGTHSIRVEHKDYKPIELELVLKKGETTTLTVNFPTKGLLKLVGDEALLSKATIAIDGKTVNYSAGKTYELSIGKKHTVEVTLEKHKTFYQSVYVSDKETKTLKVSLPLEYVPVTLMVKGKADIILYFRPKNEGSYSYYDKPYCKYKDGYTTTKVEMKTGEFGEYLIKCEKRGRVETRKYVEIDETTKEIVLKSPTPYKNFVTGNVAFNNNLGTPSFGVTYGELITKSYGMYASVLKSLSTVIHPEEVCDKDGFLSDGSFPGYVAQKSTRWSFVLGGFLRMEDLYFKLGVGPGARNVYWQAEDGTYYRNLGYSPKYFVGLDCSAGIQYHIAGRFVVSFDVVTNSFRTTDFNIGLGWSF